MQRQRKSNGPIFWLLFGMAVLVGGYVFRGGGSGGGASFESFANRTLPPIQSAATWLNTDGPLSWNDLSGKVVWLEFSFIH